MHILGMSDFMYVQVVSYTSLVVRQVSQSWETNWEMQGVREHIDDRLKFEGFTGRGTGEPSVTRSASCDATPEVKGPVGV